MIDIRGVEYNPEVAYITLETGEVFQVINIEGNDWDEPATISLRDIWMLNQI